MDQGDPRCVLLFSGGRDSTLAAVRLFRSGLRPTLVTVSAPHLSGLSAVQARPRELEPLCPGANWLQVIQPELITSELQAPTCLSCQLAYALVGAAVAVRMRVPRIAFGYTRYQNDWPEQTPSAIEYLRDALSDLNLQLLCPVSDLSSRDEAIRELKENGLSITSLEQKCTRQLTNVALQPAELERELIVWRALLGRGAERLEDLPVDVVSTALVGANPGPR